LLIEREIRFMVIGGYAVAWHGRARNTEDLDIWVDNSPENAVKIVAGLRDFGFDPPNLNEGLFTRDSGIVRLGRPPWKIELFVSIPGVEFESCYQRHALWPVDDLQVPMISLPDLKTNKIASGRPKDFADLAHYLP
jgi:hypothetical protein